MSGRIRVSPKEERTWEGIVFASKRELNEWLKLKALERAGVIVNLQRQVRYALHAYNDAKEPCAITSYVADFVFEDKDGKQTVADAKGMRTEQYKLKKKWFEWQYWPLYIVEL